MAKFSKELSQAERPESKAAFEKLTLAFRETLQRLFLQCFLKGKFECLSLFPH